MQLNLFILFIIIFFVTPVQAGGVFEKIKKNNIIQCGYAEWPDFFDVDPNSGEFSGLFYDFWNMVGEELDVKIEWSMPIQWGQVTESVATKKIDIFCNAVWPDSGRRKNMLLSDPVIYTALYAYVRSDNSNIKGKSFEFLNSAKYIGTAQDGDASEEILQKYFSNAEKELLSASVPYSDMILSVVTGKSDFVILDESEANSYIKNNPGKIKKLSEDYVLLKQVQIPIAQSEHHLLNAINGIIRDFINDGTIKHLIDKHNITGVLVPR